MSTAAQWAQTLAGEGAERFVLTFDRLGLEAECRTLRAGEVEECRRMGGERGLRYAVYLACEALREAGESLRKQGVLAGSFDITERLAYADILAAGSAILRKSGAGSARVHLSESEEKAEAETIPLAVENEAALFPAEDPAELVWQENGWKEPQGKGLTRRFDGEKPQEDAEDRVWEMARIFADRLEAAAGNL